MQEINLRNFAYLGDALWELFIRQKTILCTNNSKTLHNITTKLVNTHFQYQLLQELEKHLTPEELEITKRARNLPIPVGRRNIQHEYRQATAFETILGWCFVYNKERYYQLIEFLDNRIKQFL